MPLSRRPLTPLRSWQHELAHAIRDPAELLALLDLDPVLLPAARAAAKAFPLRVPRGYAARMRRGDPADPLLRQVLPLAAELDTVAGFDRDPVGDIKAMTVPGLLHKYRGRVLLTTTGACAIHCRYCFRRHFPYDDANPARDRWQQALDYIADDASINEVILSGGDPLTLADEKLADLCRRLAAIPHLARLRFHTRLPIVLPERITLALLTAIRPTRLASVVVAHVNHANEIDDDVRRALAALKKAGHTLLNQSVLLRGVNDAAEALCELSDRLFDAGVLPYYLHLLDRVQGAAHFDVDAETAQRLHAAMHARLPGYLVPRLVREEAGRPGKTLMA